MVLSYTTSPAYHMIAENETKYQAAAFEEGHGMQIEVAGILKSAPNPELAAQFMEFIVTDSFQSLIPTGNWMYPVVTLEDGLPTGFEKLVRPSRSLLLDSRKIAANKAAWIEEFSQAMSR